jgi:hypothetical protein
LGEGRARTKAIGFGRSAKGILVLHFHIGKRRGLGDFKGGESIHLGHSGGKVAIDSKLITIGQRHLYSLSNIIFFFSTNLKN